MLLCATTPLHAQGFVPGRVIVRYKTARPLPTQTAYAHGLVRGVRQLRDDTHLVELAGATAADTLALVAEVAQDPDVRYAQPDYLRHKASLPNDPRLAEQWALPLLHAPEAWARIPQKSDVVVAVLDSGYGDHEDLPQPGSDRYVRGYDFITCVPVPRDLTLAMQCMNNGDADGRDDDVTDMGGDFHGMHVAGIIGAIANNGKGVAGLAWNVRIQPIRVLGVDGNGADSDIADAILWASGHHVDDPTVRFDNPVSRADVINLSVGGQADSPNDPGCHASQLLQDAVDAARANGTVVVVAAGNGTKLSAIGIDVRGDMDHPCATYPADLDGVITVGASTASTLSNLSAASLHRATYSNFGPITLMAPGGTGGDPMSDPLGILSTVPLYGGYGFYDGTSQATPFVAAAAALMRSVNPNLEPDDIRALLINTANPDGRCAEGCGAGLLDVQGAIFAAQGYSKGTTLMGGCQMAPRGRPPAPGLLFALLGLVAIARAALARRRVGLSDRRRSAR